MGTGPGLGGCLLAHRQLAADAVCLPPCRQHCLPGSALARQMMRSRCLMTLRKGSHTSEGGLRLLVLVSCRRSLVSLVVTRGPPAMTAVHPLLVLRTASCTCSRNATCRAILSCSCARHQAAFSGTPSWPQMLAAAGSHSTRFRKLVSRLDGWRGGLLAVRDADHARLSICCQDTRFLASLSMSLRRLHIRSQTHASAGRLAVRTRGWPASLPELQCTHAACHCGAVCSERQSWAPRQASQPPSLQCSCSCKPDHQSSGVRTPHRRLS